MENVNVKAKLISLGAMPMVAYTLSYLNGECGYLKPHYPEDPSGQSVRLNGEGTLEIQDGIILNNEYHGTRTAWEAVAMA